MNTLGAALLEVDQAFSGLTAVVGDDSQPLVDSQGVEPRLTDSWRELLGRPDEEMVVWARTFRKAYGTKLTVPLNGEIDEEQEEVDPYADSDDQLVDD